MEIILIRFWWLVVGHAVADYPLQSDAMATEKDWHSTTPLQSAVPWVYWLTAHSFIHGGAVALITGSIWLGLAETVLHWLIDLAKCAGWTNIHLDQGLHIACKAVWAVVASQM